MVVVGIEDRFKRCLEIETLNSYFGSWGIESVKKKNSEVSSWSKWVDWYAPEVGNSGLKQQEETAVKEKVMSWISSILS